VLGSGGGDGGGGDEGGGEEEAGGGGEKGTDEVDGYADDSLFEDRGLAEGAVAESLYTEIIAGVRAQGMGRREGAGGNGNGNGNGDALVAEFQAQTRSLGQEAMTVVDFVEYCCERFGTVFMVSLVPMLVQLLPDGGKRRGMLAEAKRRRPQQGQGQGELTRLDREAVAHAVAEVAGAGAPPCRTSRTAAQSLNSIAVPRTALSRVFNLLYTAEQISTDPELVAMFAPPKKQEERAAAAAAAAAQAKERAEGEPKHPSLRDLGFGADYTEDFRDKGLVAGEEADKYYKYIVAAIAAAKQVGSWRSVREEQLIVEFQSQTQLLGQGEGEAAENAFLGYLSGRFGDLFASQTVPVLARLLPHGDKRKGLLAAAAKLAAAAAGAGGDGGDDGGGFDPVSAVHGALVLGGADAQGGGDGDDDDDDDDAAAAEDLSVFEDRGLAQGAEAETLYTEIISHFKSQGSGGNNDELVVEFQSQTQRLGQELATVEEFVEYVVAGFGEAFMVTLVPLLVQLLPDESKRKGMLAEAKRRRPQRAADDEKKREKAAEKRREKAEKAEQAEKAAAEKEENEKAAEEEKAAKQARVKVEEAREAKQAAESEAEAEAAAAAAAAAEAEAEAEAQAVAKAEAKVAAAKQQEADTAGDKEKAAASKLAEKEAAERGRRAFEAERQRAKDEEEKVAEKERAAAAAAAAAAAPNPPAPPPAPSAPGVSFSAAAPAAALPAGHQAKAETMDAEAVSDWLGDVGLGDYADAFKAAGIDGRRLLSLHWCRQQDMTFFQAAVGSEFGMGKFADVLHFVYELQKQFA
jgi:hypothetical protein